MSKGAVAAGFATVNPSTGEAIEEFEYFTPASTLAATQRSTSQCNLGPPTRPLK